MNTNPPNMFSTLNFNVFYQIAIKTLKLLVISEERNPHVDSKYKARSRAAGLSFEHWKKPDSLVLACCSLDQTKPRLNLSPVKRPNLRK